MLRNQALVKHLPVNLKECHIVQKQYRLVATRCRNSAINPSVRCCCYRAGSTLEGRDVQPAATESVQEDVKWEIIITTEALHVFYTYTCTFTCFQVVHRDFPNSVF